MAGFLSITAAIINSDKQAFPLNTIRQDKKNVCLTGFSLSLQTIRTHNRFVQDVKYSNNGDFFASVGSDSKIFLYDGKTGDTVGEFDGEGGHKGSIVSVCKFG